MAEKTKVAIICELNTINDKTEDDGAIIESGKEICNILTQHFNIHNITVSVSSISTIGSLLEKDKNSKENCKIYLIISDKDRSSSGLISYMDDNTHYPVLSFNVHKFQGNLKEQYNKCALRLAKVYGLIDKSIQSYVTDYIQYEKQKIFVHDVQLRTKESPLYQCKISNCLSKTRYVQGIDEAKFDNDITLIKGKVREQVSSKKHSDKLVLVTTDRQSGFDRMLAHVPYKGQVLNLTSKFWFDCTSDIIGNHILDVPHPNVSVVKKCTPFPIEFVMRAYMTGSTSTSIWKNYEKGCRMYCGHALPDNMRKNEKLPKILLTPTTKSDEHDELISADEIIQQGLMTQSDWDVCSDAAYKLFIRGQTVASEHGLILVDTKYEMGKDEDGNIIVIDEIHTPDSSRYWLAASYEERMIAQLEPENIDKEFLRLWFTKHCDPYKDEVLPVPPEDLVEELSRRYILLYEMITAQEFVFPHDQDDGKDVIVHVIQEIFS